MTFAATKRAKNPMNTINISADESELTVTKELEITLLDVLDPNVDILEQGELLIVSSQSEAHSILHNVVVRNSDSYIRGDVTKVMVIEVPKNIWRSRIQSKYRPPTFSNDVDDNLFLFEVLGRDMFRCKSWSPGNRSNIIVSNPSKHAAEFKYFKINKVIADILHLTLENVLKL